MTVLDFKKFKEGRKFACCTAYDYTTASVVDESEAEVILVGDTLGMIMLGHDTTVGVTLDDMIYHICTMVKGHQIPSSPGTCPSAATRRVRSRLYAAPAAYSCRLIAIA